MIKTATKMLKDLSDIAKYLEESGYIDEASKIHDVMCAIDGASEQNIVDHHMVPDNQLNIENQGYIGGESPIGGGYSMLGVDEGQSADDIEQDNVDTAVRSNGLTGNAVPNNFQGFSDSFFYTDYGNLEGQYGPQHR